MTSLMYNLILRNIVALSREAVLSKLFLAVSRRIYSIRKEFALNSTGQGFVLDKTITSLTHSICFKGTGYTFKRGTPFKSFLPFWRSGLLYKERIFSLGANFFPKE